VERLQFDNRLRKNGKGALESYNITTEVKVVKNLLAQTPIKFLLFDSDFFLNCASCFMDS